MTWLLKLYPPRWRQRYGAEFLALISPQPFSFGAAMDILGGAIDAWTQPQSHLSPRAASDPEGDTIMLTKAMRVRCAGQSVTITARDGVKGAAVVLGGSIATMAVAFLLRHQPGEHPYRMALLSNGWLFFFVISMHYWLLKGWPARAQAVFIGGLLSATIAMALAAGWIGR